MYISLDVVKRVYVDGVNTYRKNLKRLENGENEDVTNRRAMRARKQRVSIIHKCIVVDYL